MPAKQLNAENQELCWIVAASVQNGVAGTFQSETSDFGFEVQDLSNFRFFRALDESSRLMPFAKEGNSRAPNRFPSTDSSAGTRARLAGSKDGRRIEARGTIGWNHRRQQSYSDDDDRSDAQNDRIRFSHFV